MSVARAVPSAAVRLVAAAVLLVAPSPLAAAPFDGMGGAIEVSPLGAPSDLRQRLATAVERAAAGAEALEGSAEAQRAVAWRSRVGLLEEALAIVEARAELEETLRAADARLEAAQERLEEWSGEAELAVASDISREEFDALRAELAAAREHAAALRAERTLRRLRADRAPAALREAEQRRSAAEARRARHETAAALAADEAERRTLELRAENAALDAMVAEAHARHLAEEIEVHRRLEPVLIAELQAADRRLDELTLQVELASEALEARLELQRRRLRSDAVEAERAAAAAREPIEGFLASARAERLRSSSTRADVGARRVAIEGALAEQARRLAVDEQELQSVRDVSASGLDPSRIGERLDLSRERLVQRRAAFSRRMDGELLEDLHAWRARRFALDDRLFDLSETWRAQRDELLASVPEEERAEARRAAALEIAELRDALVAEGLELDAGIDAAQRLQSVADRRSEVMAEIERFVRSRSTWLRDAPPLGPDWLKGAWRERLALGTTLRAAVAPQGIRSAWSAAVPAHAWAAGALLLALPLIIFVAFRTRRLRRALAAQSDDPVAAARRAGLAALVVIATASLVGGWLRLSAMALGRITEGGALTRVASHALSGWSLSAGLVLLAAGLLRRRGVAVTHFGLDISAARTLWRAAALAALAHAALLVPAGVLEEPPFSLESIPRLLILVFQVVVAVLATVVLHRTSALWKAVAARRPAAESSTRRRPVAFAARLVLALAWAVPVLFAAGFRSASLAIGNGLVLSVAVVLALVVAHRIAARLVDDRVRRLRRARAAAPGETGESRDDVAQRVRSLMRIVFLGVGGVLLARLWGFDEQTLRELATIELLSWGDADSSTVVSLADVLTAAAWVLGTVVLLRVLPSFWELVVFPRMKADAGVRYAILTISRYVVFAVGVVVVLTALSVDFARLGWLVAALGVGIGFGLQEIVSNLVSGIILLLERPIRVGDSVTVGGTSGTVQRINIRATSVLNWDRQEVIVPNRELITKEVTNWTRGDTVLRVVIRFGVAYGTDPEAVTRVLMDAAHADAWVLDDPPPSAIFIQHGESSLDYDLRVFVPDPSQLFAARDRLNKRVNRALREAGIEIPFPQRDLHVRSVDPVAASALSRAEASGAEERSTD